MEKRISIILVLVFALLSCTETTNTTTKTTTEKKILQKNTNLKKNNSDVSGKNSQKKVTLTNRTIVEEEVNGAKVYVTYCSNCHGQDGKLALAGATDLSKSKLNLDQTISIIKNGKGNMMAYQGVINQAKIDAAAKFVMQLK